MCDVASNGVKKRHEATCLAWDWFENDVRVESFSPALRQSIQNRLEELDADLISWDHQAARIVRNDA